MTKSPQTDAGNLDIKIRELEKQDLRNGYLESLDFLAPSSGISDEKAEEIFAEIQSNPSHFIFVAEYQGEVVGGITISLEYKFIHNGSRVGHLEDWAIKKDMQGLGIGLKLLKHAINHAKESGCYKVVTSCIDELVELHSKLGFRKSDVAMRHDFA